MEATPAVEETPCSHHLWSRRSRAPTTCGRSDPAEAPTAVEEAPSSHHLWSRRPRTPTTWADEIPRRHHLWSRRSRAPATCSQGAPMEAPSAVEGAPCSHNLRSRSSPHCCQVRWRQCRATAMCGRGAASQPPHAVEEVPRSHPLGREDPQSHRRRSRRLRRLSVGNQLQLRTC